VGCRREGRLWRTCAGMGQHSARTDLDLPGRGPEQVRWTKGLTVTGRVERIDMRGTERAATRVKAMMIEC
jgi:hypothetical protein